MSFIFYSIGQSTIVEKSKILPEFNSVWSLVVFKLRYWHTITLCLEANPSFVHARQINEFALMTSPPTAHTDHSFDLYQSVQPP